MTSEVKLVVGRVTFVVALGFAGFGGDEWHEGFCVGGWLRSEAVAGFSGVLGD